MLSLTVFRDKAKGVADLLNWAALVDPGIIQCKDGSFLAGWLYQAPDGVTQTDEQRNYLTLRVNVALGRLGTGWASWTEATRLGSVGYPMPTDNHFPDPVSRAIDDERREQFETEGAHFDTEYVLLVMFTPPVRAQSRVVDMMYSGGTKETKEGLADRLLAAFKKTLVMIEDSLLSTLDIHRLGEIEFVDRAGRPHIGDELVNYLQFALTGEPASLIVPPFGMYLDAIMGGKELWPGDMPKYGDKFIAVISIEGFPGEGFPGILDDLSELPISYRWSNRMIYLDQHDADRELKRYRKKWRQKILGFVSQLFRTQNGHVNQDALRMSEEAEEALSNAASGLVKYGYYTATIVLMGADREETAEHARIVLRQIERFGFAGRVETVNAMEAWLGSIPGHQHPNVRRPVIHTLNLADLLPLSTVWPGNSTNPNPLFPPGSPPLLHGRTAGSTPFRMNIHYGDVGHTLIFGPTGAGKSVLLVVIAAQFLRYRGASVRFFDKGRSSFTLCKAVGGAHYDIGVGEDAPGFAPLSHLDGAGDIAWASEWIGTCYELSAGKPTTPAQREAINHALMLMRDETPADKRSLTAFATMVQDAAIKEALTELLVGGPYGGLLDSETDSAAESFFTVFELEEFMKLNKRVAIPTLLYLFRRFERSLKGQPALLVLDEAWMMLGNEMFKEKIREWLKVLRKANCAVVMATQSISDAVSSGIFDVLMEQCPTKILLPNEEAAKEGTVNQPGPADYYRQTGLNDVEIQILATAQRKRQYFFVSPEGKRLFELGLGDVARAFVTVSDKESLARVNELTDRYGPSWPEAWLKEQGVDEDVLAA